MKLLTKMVINSFFYTLKCVSHISYSSYNIVQLYKNTNGKLAPY